MPAARRGAATRPCPSNAPRSAANARTESLTASAVHSSSLPLSQSLHRASERGRLLRRPRLYCCATTKQGLPRQVSVLCREAQRARDKLEQHPQLAERCAPCRHAAPLYRQLHYSLFHTPLLTVQPLSMMPFYSAEQLWGRKVGEVGRYQRTGHASATDNPRRGPCCAHVVTPWGDQRAS